MVDISFDKRNYRVHTDKNKDLIRDSLVSCGGGRSILIDNDNSIIAGNGVYEQVLQLNISVRIVETNGEEIIAVKRCDLSFNDEKRRKLAIMDNSTADSSFFDYELLVDDFSSGQLVNMGISLSDLSDIDTIDGENILIDNDEEINKDISDYRSDYEYQNQNKVIFDGVGKYQIPQIKPTQLLPDNFIPFNLCKNENERQNLSVHFFIDDYRFNRVWNNVDKYISLLSDFHSVLTPDFSTYTDFPLALQIFNHFRKH